MHRIIADSLSVNLQSALPNSRALFPFRSDEAGNRRWYKTGKQGNAFATFSASHSCKRYMSNQCAQSVRFIIYQTRYMNTSRQQRNNGRGASTQVNGEARLLLHAQKENKSRLQKNDELLLGKPDSTISWYTS